MYLHEIFLQNTGPISECHVNLPFDNGNPLPVVIVGPNGSGKTIFLSYIVDALTEFAKRAYTDIVPKDGSISPYFRIAAKTAVRSGQPFSLSLLHFKVNNDNLHYCEKIGTPDMSVYSNDLNSVFSSVWNRPNIKDPKYVSVNPKTAETEMKNGAHAFFPASRREDPVWLNPQSLKAQPTSFSPHISNQLNKPLWVGTCAEENISWVLDVFLDSLIDLTSGLQLTQKQNLIYRNVNTSELTDLRNRSVLRQARENVERILQAILQDSNAKLTLNLRNTGPSRISIKRSNEQRIPTLQSLSEGQSQLFHLFATIIRYGELTDLNRSGNLSQITGLVIIDEIAAHLHPTLQHDVLPELISLFPNVQFVVSSHSPLFLLGMEKRFGVDKVTILEMPEAKQINSERYSEFGKAFEFYKTTERFEEDIKQLIANATKPVVFTEGKTDARYIQTALELFGEEELLNSLDIKPVGREGNKGTDGGGHTGLNAVLRIYTAHPLSFNHAILLLYDWEVDKQADQIEELWVRSIPKNVEDPEEKTGIENLFLHTFSRTVSIKRNLKKESTVNLT